MLFFLFCFEKRSHCIALASTVFDVYLGWPWIHSALRASASWVLGLHITFSFKHINITCRHWERRRTQGVFECSIHVLISSFSVPVPPHARSPYAVMFGQCLHSRFRNYNTVLLALKRVTQRCVPASLKAEVCNSFSSKNIADRCRSFGVL